jgi:nucleoid DNA-binding protein
MRQEDLAKAYAKRRKCSVRRARLDVAAVLALVPKLARRGLNLRELGTFEVKTRPGYAGKQRGVAVLVKPARYLSFIPSKALRDRLNK